MKHLTALQSKFATIVVFFLAVTFQAYAVNFYSINALFGISNRVTNSLCKDDNGFVWASSKTGILRLTDTEYRVYDLPYENAGAVVVNLKYRNSKLTAYTNNGQLFEYNPVKDRFELKVNCSKLVKMGRFDLYTLLVDDSGDYWLALSSGLYKYHSGNLSLVEKNTGSRYSITWYDNNRLLVVRNTGIWMLDIHSLKSECIHTNKNETSFVPSAFYLDAKKDKLWIGTFSKGLFCFNFLSNTLTPVQPSLFPKQPVLSIEENSPYSILIGIDGQGLWELDKGSNRIMNVYKEDADDPNSLRGNGVYDILYDPDKRVWVCTVSGGVSFYELGSPLVNQITHHANDVNSLVNNDVNGIAEDRNGNIWFATNNGLSCWRVADNRWKHFYNNKLTHAQVFLTVCEDDQGRIWAGTYSSGFYILDGKTGRELAHYSRDKSDFSQISNFIFDIFKDSQGDMWVGGISGRFLCYQSKEKTFKTFGDETVSAFAELSPGQILMGGNGIKVLDKQTGRSKPLISGCEVQDLLVFDGRIWVGTNGQGLLEYDIKNKSIRKYTSKEGLPSNFVNSLSVADHYIWLGTENGLCRFDPTDKKVVTFSSLYPLLGNSYNKCAIRTLKNGQLACGSNNGAVLFDPNTIKEVSTKGRIYYQDITVSGRSIRNIPSFKLDIPVDKLSSVNLNHTQNTLSLELIPLDMQSGSLFSWKLEGFDKAWTLPQNNRIITYTNIPSGTYTLKIRLYDSSQTHLIAERSLAIHMVPPFWRTAWFWLLIILVVSGMVFLYLLYYINRLKQQHTEEKVRFFTNTAHDMRTSLTLIKAPVEELEKERGLTESGRYYLNLALGQIRQLAGVVTQLMDFQKADIGREQLSLNNCDIVKLITDRTTVLEPFAKVKHVELSFSSDTEACVTAIDEVKMERIVDNLISNAIKYSKEGGRVWINLSKREEKWSLEINDEGIGISKKAQRQLFKEFYRGENAVNAKIVGSGIGLLLVKKYVQLHGGSVGFDSQENKGSTFRVEIPFKSVPNKSAIKSSSVDDRNVVDDRTLVDDRLLRHRASAVETEPAHPNGGHEPTEETVHEMNVLIVEDNDELLQFLKTTLGSNFNVSTAVDGAEAWAFIVKQVPDLVVSDIMMPNMDGFELCRMIKSTYDTSHIPVILLTALSEKTDQLHGLGLGADDYLTKPFDTAVLIERIKSIIRNRELVREKALSLSKGEPVKPILNNELNDAFVKKMFLVVQENRANADFDKNEFARAMHVSGSLLYKKVKALTDQSPTEFIRTVRINHAIELLQSGKYSVTEVSELCGFSSLTYFGIVFKKITGKSPSALME